jgi:rhamnogalacturonyl hydrolase YesR
MLDGVTRRLYEFGDFFSETKNGWFYDVDDGWEEIPYWLRGFYPLAVLTNDTRCLKVAKQYIDKAIDSQDEDGYFGPSNMKNIIGKDGRITSDLWPHMLMLHPIISYYEYTKDDRVIPFLTKFFMFCKNLPEDQFILKDGVGYSGWGGSTFGAFRPFLQYTEQVICFYIYSGSIIKLKVNGY